MKKIANLSFLFIFTFTIIQACDNEPKKETSRNSLKNSQVKSTTGNSCFESYVGKPELLLTAELVGQFVDFEGQTPSVEKVEIPFKKSTNVVNENATVNCKWKVDRKRRIVRLQNIKKINLYKSKTAVDRFYDKYQTRNESEKEAQKELYDKEVIDKTEDKNTKEIGNKIIDFDFEYQKTESVGDAAVWEHKVNNLLVLIGDYQFTVNVKLTKGIENDLEKAIEIAKAIIDKACD